MQPDGAEAMSNVRSFELRAPACLAGVGPSWQLLSRGAVGARHMAGDPSPTSAAAAARTGGESASAGALRLGWERRKERKKVRVKEPGHQMSRAQEQGCERPPEMCGCVVGTRRRQQSDQRPTQSPCPGARHIRLC